MREVDEQLPDLRCTKKLYGEKAEMMYFPMTNKTHFLFNFNLFLFASATYTV